MISMIVPVFSRRPLAGYTYVAMAMVAIGWHWPRPSPITVAEEKAFEEEHGISIWIHGSREVGLGGMMLLILITWVALGSLLFSYYITAEVSRQFVVATKVAQPA